MTNQQCKETINALAEAGAIMFAPNNIWKAAELTLFGLEKRGYTITRAEPALISDEKLREAVAMLWRPGIENELRTIETAISELQARRETMTEAELERELMDKSFSVVGGRIIGVDTAREIAKKYRGWERWK